MALFIPDLYMLLERLKIHRLIAVPLSIAMASIVDSEAQFDLRLEQVKVPSQLQRALKNAEVSTISSLAYAHGQPGQPIIAADFETWVRQLDPAATVGGVSSLKRLLFESQTQLLAILKEQVMNPEPSVARKVPPAERETRLANLKTRLVGVLVEEHCGRTRRAKPFLVGCSNAAI